MSAEQRSPHRIPSADELVAARQRSRPALVSDSESLLPSGVRQTRDSSLVDPPLHSRIERTQLRLQVAALERALETSEYRRQEVIDRYEHLLAERDAAIDESSTSETRTGSSLKRLLGV